MEIYAEHYPDKSVIIIDRNKLIGIENEELQKTVQDCIDKECKSISINLAKVEYMASWGIGILVYAYTTCTNKKVGFSLESVNENVMRVLHQLKLDKLFIIN